jgi:hypothetical protein
MSRLTVSSYLSVHLHFDGQVSFCLEKFSGLETENFLRCRGKHRIDAPIRVSSAVLTGLIV